MSVEIFDVVPDKLEYWPGETVTGKVMLKVNGGSFQSQGIYLNLKGEASVLMVEESRERKHHARQGVGRRGTVDNITSSRTHNSQNLLSISTYVAGDGGTPVSHREGETSYPFSIPLPPHLISSYYRSDGTTSLGITVSQTTVQIIYNLELGMILPGRSDQVTRKAIGIHTHLDLNAVPEASQAGEGEATKTFGNSLVCCYGGHNGSLTLKVKTEKRGFLPGENISFEVEIKNKSESVIKKVSAQLIEAVTVVIKGGSQCVPFPLPGMVESSQQFTGEDENWSGELVIPQEGGVYPSKLGGGCHIIDVDYFIKIVAQVQSCCKADLEVFSSIIIGTCRTAAGVLSTKSKSFFEN